MGTSFCGDILTKEEESNSRKSILRDIKSSHIINKIFSYVNENRKLNIIKYNKSFQNILLINIEYYKKISGKYKINGINGNGEEYGLITDKIIFKGEYKNGKRNGKGKEYFHYGIFERELGYFIYNHCITFEGEYLNDKKWNGKAYDEKGKEIYEIKNGKGNIKEYNRYGDLSLECEIVNGEKNGKCKEYIYNTLEFEGKYFNGKKWNGKEYDNKHIIYEGDYLNGRRWNGKYKEYNNDNLLFEGEIFNGKKWNGKGYDNKGNIIYEIKNGNGKIKEFYDDSHISKYLIIYEKEYLNEETNKKGKIYDI